MRYDNEGFGRGALEHEPGVMYAYTDGSCNVRDRSGGWGMVLVWCGHEREEYGGAPDQTTNTMELTAILRAFQARSRPVPMTVISDSQYALQCVSLWHHGWSRNGWITGDGKPVKNRALIQEIVSHVGPDDRFHWVKGHAGHAYNERVDKLAHRGRIEHGGGVEPEKKPRKKKPKKKEAQ